VVTVGSVVGSAVVVVVVGICWLLVEAIVVLLFDLLGRVPP
jgi:hypothetical protein